MSLTRSNSRINRPVLVVQSQPKHQETKPKKQANVRITLKTRPGVKASTNELELSPDEAQKLNVRFDPSFFFCNEQLQPCFVHVGHLTFEPHPGIIPVRLYWPWHQVWF